MLTNAKLVSNDMSPVIPPSSDRQPDLVERSIVRLKNIPWVAALIILTAIVGGLATWADAFKKVREAVIGSDIHNPESSPTPSIQFSPTVTVNPQISVNAPSSPSATHDSDAALSEDTQENHGSSSPPDPSPITLEHLSRAETPRPAATGTNLSAQRGTVDPTAARNASTHAVSYGDSLAKPSIPLQLQTGRVFVGSVDTTQSSSGEQRRTTVRVLGSCGHDRFGGSVATSILSELGNHSPPGPVTINIVGGTEYDASEGSGTDVRLYGRYTICLKSNTEACPPPPDKCSTSCRISTAGSVDANRKVAHERLAEEIATKLASAGLNQTQMLEGSLCGS